MDRRDLKSQIDLIKQSHADDMKNILDPALRQQKISQTSDLINNLTAQHGDDLQKLNLGKSIRFPGLKKVMGILPFAGAGMAALQGDPAMAAEELAQDAMGPAGVAYDAIRPEMAGNPEDDAMMKAESDSFKNYKNSPAGQAAKYAQIRNRLAGK